MHIGNSIQLSANPAQTSSLKGRKPSLLRNNKLTQLHDSAMTVNQTYFVLQLVYTDPR